MYASLEITIGVPGSYDEGEKMAAQAPDTFKAAKGFRSAVFFSDKARNEYGLLTIWERKGDYETFRKSIPAAMTKKIKAFSAGTLFEQRTFYVNNSFSADKPAGKK